MKRLLLLFCITLSVSIKAQTLFDYEAYAYTAYESITCFAPEGVSCMWMGDKLGNIQCYDGQSWKQKSWVNSHINCMKIDDNGVKWIATRTKGLFRYDGNSLFNFNTSNSILHTNDLKYLEIGPNNKVWICTESNKVYSIDATGSWTKFDYTNSPWAFKSVINIQKAPNQNVYFATGNSSLYSVNQNGTWDSLTLSVGVNAFKFDVANNLYTCLAWGKVYKHQNGLLVDSSKQTISGQPSQGKLNIEFDAQGSMWITGMAIYEFIGLDSMRTYTRTSHGLSGNYVAAFVVDGLGNRWVSYSTYNTNLTIDIFTNNGIIKHGFKQSSLPARNSVLLSNKSGDLYCHTFNESSVRVFSKLKGQYEWTELLHIKPEFLPGFEAPTVHYHEARQELWIEAYMDLYKMKNGIATCDSGALYHSLTSSENYFLETPDGDVILVTRAGFWSNLETQPVFNPHNYSLHISPNFNTVGTPFFDYNKHLWIPISNVGYCKYNGTQWSRLDVATLGIPNLGSLVLNMIQTTDSTYWLSNEYGLFELKNGVVNKYDSTNSKVRNAVVYGLCEDRDKNVWFFNGQFTSPPSIHALMRIDKHKNLDEVSTNFLPFDTIDFKIPSVNRAGDFFISGPFGYVQLKPRYPLNNLEFTDTDDELVLYPNPASTEVFISNFQNGEWVELYDMQSKLLKRTKAYRMDISLLPSGTYFVKHGKRSSKLLIKH